MQEFKDGGGGNEEALFFYSCNWLFCEMVVFSVLFQNSEYLRISEGIRHQDKNCFL